MSELKGSAALPVRKSIRSKMIKRLQKIKNDSFNENAKLGEHSNRVEEVGELKRSQSTTAGKVLVDKRNQSTKIGRVQNTRTAPKGRRQWYQTEQLSQWQRIWRNVQI